MAVIDKPVRMILAAAVLALAAPVGAGAQDAEAAAEPAVYDGPTVYIAEPIAQYPHDESAFTQGLLWHDGALIESTGRRGRSLVRRVDLETGQTLAERRLPEDQFGEGITRWEDALISLTWHDGVIHRWDGATLEPIGSVENYPLEGWGLTTSEEGLIHSDGSDTLRVLDPVTFEVRRSIPVTLGGRPLRQLNELEMIDGLIYANLWKSPYIIAIDPADGTVRKVIDLSAIVDSIPISDPQAVLNGIAWDAEKRRLFVTGKLWPSLFEIRLVETDAQAR